MKISSFLLVWDTTTWSKLKHATQHVSGIFFLLLGFPGGFWMEIDQGDLLDIVLFPKTTRRYPLFRISFPPKEWKPWSRIRNVLMYVSDAVCQIMPMPLFGFTRAKNFGTNHSYVSTLKWENTSFTCQPRPSLRGGPEFGWPAQNSWQAMLMHIQRVFAWKFNTFHGVQGVSISSIDFLIFRNEVTLEQIKVGLRVPATSRVTTSITRVQLLWVTTVYATCQIMPTPLSTTSVDCPPSGATHSSTRSPLPSERSAWACDVVWCDMMWC